MIYKNKYFATIEPELFNSLEQTIKNHDYHYDKSDSNRIMMDKAVFLIDYIRYQKSIRKDDILTNGFIRIPSKLLNVFLKKELIK